MTRIMHRAGIGITHGAGDGLSEFPSDLADAGTAGSAAAFSVQTSDASALVTLASSIRGSDAPALCTRVLVAVSVTAWAGASTAAGTARPALVRHPSCRFSRLEKEIAGRDDAERKKGHPPALAVFSALTSYPARIAQSKRRRRARHRASVCLPQRASASRVDRRPRARTHCLICNNLKPLCVRSGRNHARRPRHNFAVLKRVMQSFTPASRSAWTPPERVTGGASD